jgi:hypothetical protein
VLVVVAVEVVGVPVVDGASRVVVVSVVVVSFFWQPTESATPRIANAARVRNFFMSSLLFQNSLNGCTPQFARSVPSNRITAQARTRPGLYRARHTAAL